MNETRPCEGPGKRQTLKNPARTFQQIFHMNSMGFTPKQKTGDEWAGPCPDPACGGRDRFCFWVGGQGKHGLGRFYCRGCGRQGDAIQFLREFQGLGYGEACRALGLSPSKPSGHEYLLSSITPHRKPHRLPLHP